MKHVWDAEDTRAGLVVENTKTTAENRFSILGYRYDGSAQLRTVTDLTDGMQLFQGNADALAAFLNDGYAPVTTPVQAFKLIAGR